MTTAGIRQAGVELIPRLASFEPRRGLRDDRSMAAKGKESRSTVLGRIGRAVFRIPRDRGDLDVVRDQRRHRRRYARIPVSSTTRSTGCFRHDVALRDATLVVARQSARMLSEKDPKNLPWKDMGVDGGLEATVALPQGPSSSTGTFDARSAQGVSDRAVQGTPSITPACWESTTRPDQGPPGGLQRVVHDRLPSRRWRAILHESFGIRRGLLTTVHA